MSIETGDFKNFTDEDWEAWEDRVFWIKDKAFKG